MLGENDVITATVSVRNAEGRSTVLRPKLSASHPVSGAAIISPMNKQEDENGTIHALLQLKKCLH